MPVTNFKQAVDWANYWVDMKGLDLGNFMVAEFLNGKEYAVKLFGSTVVWCTPKRVKESYTFLATSCLLAKVRPQLLL